VRGAPKLRKHLPNYRKTRLDFAADFADGLDDALKWAKELDPTGEDHERNPSTGVWRLVKLIREKM
jgi:hypothetical protein